MKFTYYPGCSLHSTASEYDLSTRSVFRVLGIELEELEDWNCCGASSGHTRSHYLAQALPLRNLVLAERQGSDVLAPCAACFNILKGVEQLMVAGGPEAEELNRDIAGIMGRIFEGRIQVRHVLEVFSDQDVKEQLKARIKRSLQGLKLASYYGCLLTRPVKVVSLELNPEQPVLMDNLLHSLGATDLAWTHKNECCGASLTIPRPELVVHLVDGIVQAARRAGAQAIVTACPLCQSNIDTRQRGGAGSQGEGLPVFFITELIALALDTPEVGHCLRKHIIDPRPLLNSLSGKVA